MKVAYQRKQWQFNDIITEGELNRMEEGIEEGITKAEQAGQVAQQAQQTANQAASDLASHLNESVSQQQGAHGIRVQNGKLEWQDGNEWKNIEIEIGVVESGQNVNGEYIRFSNGIQICWKREDVFPINRVDSTIHQNITVYESTDQTWTFPASFISKPTVLISGDIEGGKKLESFVTFNTQPNLINWAICAITSFTSVRDLSLMAIGRWK